LDQLAYLDGTVLPGTIPADRGEFNLLKNMFGLRGIKEVTSLDSTKPFEAHQNLLHASIAGGLVKLFKIIVCPKHLLHYLRRRVSEPTFPEHYSLCFQHLRSQVWDFRGTHGLIPSA